MPKKYGQNYHDYVSLNMRPGTRMESTKERSRRFKRRRDRSKVNTTKPQPDSDWRKAGVFWHPRGKSIVWLFLEKSCHGQKCVVSRWLRTPFSLSANLQLFCSFSPIVVSPALLLPEMTASEASAARENKENVFPPTNPQDPTLPWGTSGNS